jgi:hypothetical protein
MHRQQLGPITTMPPLHPRKCASGSCPTYQRIRHQIQALEAQAKRTRFRKEIDIRTFSYHVADSN